jgi:lupus La protein
MTVEEISTSPVDTTAAESLKAANPAVSDLDAKILKQIEFYFGDANLPRDKFLQEKIKEKDGWVDLSVLASFSRMKNLSEDIAVIAEAVSKSTELLELNEDKTCVRRRLPLPESQETLLSSVYVKGFPSATTLDELQEYFRGVSEKVQAIRMRRNPESKEFKGSVFVELGSAEEANRVASLELKHGEANLVVMTKMKYFESKNASRTSSKKAEVEAKPFEYTKGCLICVDEVPEGVTFNQIKEALNAKQHPAAFASIDNGVATVRFKEALTEETFNSIAELEVEGGHTLKTRRATEEEEKTFYEAFEKDVKSAKSARGGSHGRGNRGGRGGSNKRHRTD